jgi:signal transduction histidine kinase
MHLRITPPSWLRLPRRTARLRFTLLYSAIFLLSGVALLAVTYLLFEHAIDDRNVLGTPPHRGSSSLATTGKPPPHVQASIAAANRELATQRASDLHQLLVNSGIALAIVAVLAILLGWYVAGRVLRPVRTISATARQIGASNLHQRLNLDGPDDEFRELAATLDDLLQRLDTSFESQRRFVANASHELRTPLTLDRALLERALRNPEPDQAFWRTTCERLLASSRQQDRLVEALLTLARSEGTPRRMETFELSTIVDNVLLSPELDDRSRGLQIKAKSGPAPVSGDARLVERLVRNLVDNAIRYNQPQGQVDITTWTRSGRAVLVVSNTGPMIPPTDIDRLFQPFERLPLNRSNQGDGTGLGLSIVKAIADAHDALVAAVPQPHGGLSIEVTFPPARTRDPQTNNPRTERPISSRHNEPPIYKASRHPEHGIVR